MVQVSLTTVGNTNLKGGSGSVKLADIVANRFTRTLVADGYARVNPYEVGGGQAPSEEAAPHSLNDWEGYVHQDVEAGTQLAVTGGYGEVSLTWTKPNDYPDSVAEGTELVDQVVVLKDTDTTDLLTASAVDPRTAPDKTVIAGDDAEESGITVGFVADGDYVAISVFGRWDDSDEIFEDSTEYTAASGQDPLTGASQGVLARVFDDTPAIDSVTQSPSPANCNIGCSGSACPDIIVSITMDGPSPGEVERSINDGAWTFFSSLVAGATSFTDADETPGNKYEYRIRYTDIDGQGLDGPWSNVGVITLQCDQV